MSIIVGLTGGIASGKDTVAVMFKRLGAEIIDVDKIADDLINTRLDGDNIKIISNFGILALKENNTDEAIGFFRTVLEIEPDDQIAKKYLEFLTKQ